MRPYEKENSRIPGMANQPENPACVQAAVADHTLPRFLLPDLFKTQKLQHTVMAHRSQQENHSQKNHSVLNEANRIFPRKDKCALPIVRGRIHKQGDEGGYGKDIEKEPIETIFVSERTFEEFRNGYGNQGAMGDAIGNPQDGKQNITLNFQRSEPPIPARISAGAFSLFRDFPEG